MYVYKRNGVIIHTCHKNENKNFIKNANYYYCSNFYGNQN